VVGVPAGVALLRVASPELLKTTVGAFLVMYAAFQLGGAARFAIGQWGGRGADAAVGVGGGFLGGFSGLSGPLPLIWLQLRGGKSAGQRATYQPFNLVVLALAALGMGISGQIDSQVLLVSAAATPVTLLGAWTGVKAYAGVGEELFRRVVLCLLLASGAILLVQNVKSKSLPRRYDASLMQLAVIGRIARWRSRDLHVSPIRRRFRSVPLPIIVPCSLPTMDRCRCAPAFMWRSRGMPRRCIR